MTIFSKHRFCCPTDCINNVSSNSSVNGFANPIIVYIRRIVFSSVPVTTRIWITANCGGKVVVIGAVR